MADRLEQVYDKLSSPESGNHLKLTYSKPDILEVLDTLHECGKLLGKDFDTGTYTPQ